MNGDKTGGDWWLALSYWVVFLEIIILGMIESIIKIIFKFWVHSQNEQLEQFF